MEDVMSIPNLSGALIRIQMEYVEMPGLQLTLVQASRLCALPIEMCRAALVALTASGFLNRDGHGVYRRSGSAPMQVATADGDTWTLGTLGA
jgi:hypothetical protein